MDAHQHTSLRRGSGLDFYLFDHWSCEIRRLLTSEEQIKFLETWGKLNGVSHRRHTVFSTIQKFGYMKKVHSPVGRRSSDSFILVMEKVGYKDIPSKNRMSLKQTREILKFPLLDTVHV